VKISRADLLMLVKESIAQISEEEEIVNLTPQAGDSAGDTEVPAVAAKPEQKNTADVQLVLTHLQKINTPQEQIQIMSHLLDMLLGRGSSPDQLSKDQRVIALRRALEDKFGKQGGPLLSAFQNLLTNVSSDSK